MGETPLEQPRCSTTPHMGSPCSGVFRRNVTLWSAHLSSLNAFINILAMYVLTARAFTHHSAFLQCGCSQYEPRRITTTLLQCGVLVVRVLAHLSNIIAVWGARSTSLSTTPLVGHNTDGANLRCATESAPLRGAWWRSGEWLRCSNEFGVVTGSVDSVGASRTVPCDFFIGTVTIRQSATTSPSTVHSQSRT